MPASVSAAVYLHHDTLHYFPCKQNLLSSVMSLWWLHIFMKQKQHYPIHHTAPPTSNVE